jgi:hypothetical protein
MRCYNAAMSDLRESWRKTEEHLRNSAAMLPQISAHHSEWFNHFLDRNELECALTQLDDAASETNSSPDFWHEMATAAAQMELRDRADKYRRRASLASPFFPDISGTGITNHATPAFTVCPPLIKLIGSSPPLAKG